MTNSQMMVVWRSVVRRLRIATLPFRVISLRYRWFASSQA
jgi:hypothetical protein